jgi:hypothetical protein
MSDENCPVCKSSERELRRPASGWVKGGMLPGVICSECLLEWYDPTEKQHDSWESVGEYVRRKRATSGKEIAK